MENMRGRSFQMLRISSFILFKFSVLQLLHLSLMRQDYEEVDQRWEMWWMVEPWNLAGEGRQQIEAKGSVQLMVV